MVTRAKPSPRSVEAASRAKSRRHGLGTAWILLACTVAADPGPKVSSATTSFARFPGLQWARSESERFEWLLREARCLRCHDAPAGWKDRFDPGPAPELGRRLPLRPKGFVAVFLVNPSENLPGTLMPDVLGALRAERRAAAARALAAFLRVRFPAAAVESARPVHPLRFAQGRALFHQVGCLACHAPFDSAPSAPSVGEEPAEGPIDPDPAASRRTVPLEPLATRWTRASLTAFLREPRPDPAARMPAFGFGEAEAAALAEYLVGREWKDGRPPPACRDVPSPFQPAEVEQGRRLWIELRCGACHELPDPPPPEDGPPAPARLDRLGPGLKQASCLDTRSPAGRREVCHRMDGSPAPRYAFDPADAEGIQRWIARGSTDPPGPWLPAEAAWRRLARFNCLACHRREDRGGLSREQSRWFATLADWDAGWEGRLPPYLDGVGAKLQPKWLVQVPAQGTRVRPYLAARMPRIPRRHAAELADWLARADTPTGWKEEQPPEPDMAPPQIGRRLLDDGGLGCVTCHAFESRRGLTMNMLNLAWTRRRLQWPWFRRYLEDPVRWRPGTRMPSFWPEGRPVSPVPLDGDPHRQIGAIWHALAVTRSPGDGQQAAGIPDAGPPKRLE